MFVLQSFTNRSNLDVKQCAKPSPCLEKQKGTIDRSERMFFFKGQSISEQDVNSKPLFINKVLKKTNMSR